MPRVMFTRMPFTVINSSLTTIPSADVEAFSSLELDSYEQWNFGGNASSLNGLVNNRAMTAQSASPIYFNKYISVSGTFGSALLSPLEEVAGAVDTIAVVARLEADSGGTVLPFGSLGSSTGGSPFLDGTGGSRTVYVNYRGPFNANTGLFIPQGSWLFVAISRNFSGSSKTIKVMVGGSTLYEGTGTTAFSPAASGNKISLGNPYLSSGTAGSVWNFSELVLYQRALTPVELSALYTRAKARAAASGITVV